MATNPNYPTPNKDISLATIRQRTFDPDDDCVRVCVEAGNISIDPGDIQIGAVEIKDDDSDLRASVVACDPNNNGLLVIDCVEQAKTKVNVFGSSMISPGATVTLTTVTVSSGVTFTFTGGIVGGEEHGEFTFEVGGSTVALARNSGSNRTIQLRFLEPPSAGASTVLNIKAKNIGHKTKQFEATLSGFTLAV